MRECHDHVRRLPVPQALQLGGRGSSHIELLEHAEDVGRARRRSVALEETGNFYMSFRLRGHFGFFSPLFDTVRDKNGWNGMEGKIKKVSANNI